MNPPDSVGGGPSGEYDQWYGTPKDDHWAGEPLIFPEGYKYDAPLTREMIVKAQGMGFINNDDIESLGTHFKTVYDGIEAILHERFPGIRMHELMMDWGLFESPGKTE